MNSPRFSVIIPARNEERFLGACLESIRVAALPFPEQVEMIVVLNRCTDRTEAIANRCGARTVREDARNLAAIRNAGARSASGQVLVTIDADSTMSPRTLACHRSGARLRHDRGRGHSDSPGSSFPRHPGNAPSTQPLLLVGRFSGGLFWCFRKDFEAIGGFNETLVSGEDIDFARRLKAYGKYMRRPFSTLRDAHIVTSCRKFDAYGDWCVVRNPLLIWRLFTGRNRRAADSFYYDFKR